MAYKPRKDIKVSETYIQKLRDAGSKKAALEKYGSSSDPKMREALRRFYGATAPAPMTDSKRAKLGTLPKKSVAMAKPKTKTMGSRTGGKITVTDKPKTSNSVGKKLDTAARNVYKYAGPENFIAGGAAIKVGKTVSKTAKAVSIAKNTRTLATATGSKANLARTKIGKAKGLATKSEVKQAKAAVNKKRGMK
jgi:hypothetical protein